MSKNDLSMDWNAVFPNRRERVKRIEEALSITIWLTNPSYNVITSIFSYSPEICLSYGSISLSICSSPVRNNMISSCEGQRRRRKEIHTTYENDVTLKKKEIGL